jgi:hypothetical protein
MKRKFKVIFFQLAFLLCLLLVVEFALRKMGYKPGDMKPNWLNFKPVDSLYVVPDFYTNNEGLLLADSSFFAGRKVHINEEGFRSPDFAKLDSNKKKVLFIGDSFTWGMSAQPVENNCFVDLVRNETNYEVINLGIPATDPPQYFLLARKYIPRFKPAMTFVIFFMGNDLMMEDRQIIPNEPFYYYTNAGAILADIDGHHFKSAQEAYDYFVNDKYYLHKPDNYFEWIVSKSALLSRLYSLRFRIEEKLRYEKMVKETSTTKKYLKGIQAIGRLYHVPVKFVLVPEIKEANMDLEDYKKKYSDILLDSELKNDWLIFKNAKSDFRDYPDAHLNNAGHRHYADYLESYLKSSLGNK